MGFNGGFGFVPTFTGGGGGGSWPTTGPSTVRWGKTLVVSSSGDDATGNRGDLAFHYSTIEGAFADAQAEDLIIVMPGVHSVNSVISIVNATNIHLFPGATIQTPANNTLFRIDTATTFRLTGNGTINVETGSVFVEQTAIGSVVVLEFDQLNVSTQAYGVYMLTGTLFLKCKEKILATGDQSRPLYLNDENATLNAYLDINFGGDEFTGNERQTAGFGLLYAGVANSVDSSIDLSFKVIRCNINGSAINCMPGNTIGGRISIVGDVIKNEPDISFQNDQVCCLYSQGGYKTDFLLQADLIGKNYARGYVSIPGGDDSTTIGTGARISIKGNITTDEMACIYVGGNSLDLYYADGCRENKKLLASQIEGSIVLGNYDGGSVHALGRTTFLQLSGTDKCLTNEAVIQLNNDDTTPVKLRLKNQTTIGTDGETNFSVNSYTELAADVQVFSHCSNIPVNPDWITEVISNSIVDSLITE